jgi:hypothetical protein
MSKVHGAFLWIGMGAFLGLNKRELLRKPQPYIATLITFIIASPILIWNIQHDFVTYRFHSARVEVDNSVELYGAAREFVGQLVFNNPVNVAMIILALTGWRKHNLSRYPALFVFKWVGLPLALILLFVSFFKDTTLPHWSGPGYVALLPLAAVRLSLIKRNSMFPHSLRWALGIFVGSLIAWTVVVFYYPGTYGTKKAALYGRGDISLDIYGWQDASRQFKAIYDEDIKQGLMPANVPLVTTYWWGAHIEYYMARPHDIQMLGIGTIHELREYWWMNNNRKASVNMNQAYCIMPSDESYDLPEQYYASMELAKVIEVERNGKPTHYFRVYRLRGLKPEAAQLSLPQ